MGVRTGRPRGRPPGASNKRTKEREAIVAKAARAVEGLLPEPFRGDAHTYLMTVYKDQTAALKDRLAAATAALPYEKPRLSAVEHSGSIAAKAPYELTDDELAIVACGSSEGAADETEGPQVSH